MTATIEPTKTGLVKTENPMQERNLGQVAESALETAEAILTARRLEIRKEADGSGSLLFVP